MPTASQQQSSYPNEGSYKHSEQVELQDEVPRLQVVEEDVTGMNSGPWFPRVR